MLRELFSELQPVVKRLQVLSDLESTPGYTAPSLGAIHRALRDEVEKLRSILIRWEEANLAEWDGVTAEDCDPFDYDLDAEQCVLGAILLDNEAINHALEILAPEDFYYDAHREIYRAMIELTDLPAPVDAITLKDWLKKNGKLESIGGPVYIAELASVVPTASNIAHYAQLVREQGRQGS